jgi:hypothetical protein
MIPSLYSAYQSLRHCAFSPQDSALCCCGGGPSSAFATSVMHAATASVSPLKIPYTSVRKGQRYFEPRGRMLEHGFEPKSLGPDNELSRRAAWLLIEQWRAVREGRPQPRPLTKETASTAKEYPAGSIGAAWQDWICTPEWRALADSTRTKIWWPAWLKRIEPVFGDCAPDSVTMDLLSDWRATVEATTGLDAAHKALKVWRALWRVMQALRYTQLTDPSEKVRNRQPPPRHARCTARPCRGRRPLGVLVTKVSRASS